LPRLPSRRHNINEASRASHTRRDLFVLYQLADFLDLLIIEPFNFGRFIGSFDVLLSLIEGLMVHYKVDRVNHFAERVFNVAALNLPAPSLWLSQRDKQVKTLSMVILDAELRVRGPSYASFFIFHRLWNAS
jgi:hypothetical protein